MNAHVDEIVHVLRTAGVRLEHGLEAWERRAIEHEFSFQFSGMHEALLRTVLPCDSTNEPGRGWSTWPDWRWGAKAELWERIQCPADAVVSGVRSREFWHQPGVSGHHRPKKRSEQRVSS